MLSSEWFRNNFNVEVYNRNRHGTMYRIALGYTYYGSFYGIINRNDAILRDGVGTSIHVTIGNTTTKFIPKLNSHELLNRKLNFTIECHLCKSFYPKIQTVAS